MNQLTISDIEYSQRRRKTKREEFLDSMDEIIPWSHWISLIQPYYYNNKRGRRPIDIEIMLRMYLMQNWFNLSDEGMEEAIYDSYAMRKFLKINFLDEQVPDATTLLKFRHLLEKHHIGEKIFQDVTDRLEKAGLIMHGGTIVDATIIAAPSSTKNKEGKRDPEKEKLFLGVKGGRYVGGRLENYTPAPEKLAGPVSAELDRIKSIVDAQPGAEPFALIPVLMKTK